MLTFEEARRKVIEQVGKMRGPRERATVALWDALGLVLVQEIKTDREYPPFDRSTRDGYAVRSSEVKPGTQLKCAGEIKAGDSVTEALAPGTCIQIMTGAAVPAAADAVVMIEYTQREGELVRFERGAQSWQNGDINQSNSAYRTGDGLPYRVLIDSLSDLQLATPDPIRLREYMYRSCSASHAPTSASS